MLLPLLSRKEFVKGLFGSAEDVKVPCTPHHSGGQEIYCPLPECHISAEFLKITNR